MSNSYVTLVKYKSNKKIKHLNLFFKVRLFVLSLFSVILFTPVSAQEPISNDTLLHRLWKQTQLYPQEKVYAGTDRSVYVAGDTVRFSVQVVNFLSFLCKVKNTKPFVLINMDMKR